MGIPLGRTGVLFEEGIPPHSHICSGDWEFPLAQLIYNFVQSNTCIVEIEVLAQSVILSPIIIIILYTCLLLSPIGYLPTVIPGVYILTFQS